MTIETTQWDVTEHLDSEEMIAAYLDAIMEEGGVALMRTALGDVAKARGMTDLAERTGITRSGLYKALAEKGNPSMDTMDTVLRAMGLRLSISPIKDPAEAVVD